MKLKHKISILSAVVLLSTTAFSWAAQKKLPLEMLCQHAERIVIAEVVSMRVLPEPVDWIGLGPLTTTEVTLKIEARWKGPNDGNEVTVLVPGGTDHKTGLTTRLSGNVRFSVGERALIFINETEDRRHVYGWEQGKYPIIVKRVVGNRAFAIAEDILLHPLEKKIKRVLSKLESEKKSAPQREGAGQ